MERRYTRRLKDLVRVSEHEITGLSVPTPRMWESPRIASPSPPTHIVYIYFESLLQWAWPSTWGPISWARASPWAELCLRSQWARFRPRRFLDWAEATRRRLRRLLRPAHRRPAVPSSRHKRPQSRSGCWAPNFWACVIISPFHYNAFIRTRLAPKRQNWHALYDDIAQHSQFLSDWPSPTSSTCPTFTSLRHSQVFGLG